VHANGDVMVSTGRCLIQRAVVWLPKGQQKYLETDFLSLLN